MVTDELKEALYRLRAQWPNHWTGLPLVLAQCLARLNHPTRSEPSRRYVQLLGAAEELARQVEAAHAAMAAHAHEASYHNRLHFADTLWCMTALLLAARHTNLAGKPARLEDGQFLDLGFSDANHLKDNGLRDEQELLLMLVMVTHDFGHDGRVNQFPMEMEKLSANRAEVVLQSLGLPEIDIDTVRRLVERTDPLRVTENHSLASQRVFDLSDLAWLQVLANEADIFASALPEFGESLGHALSREWIKEHAAMAESVISPKGRLFFLEKIAIFSTPASHYLGLQESRRAQIEVLKNALPTQ